MKPEVHSLESGGYKKLFGLNHMELVPFVKDFLFKKNVSTISYLISNVILVVLFLWHFVAFIIEPNGSVGEAFKYFGYGCALAFVLILPHELLHGLAYTICGAEKVSYKANWQKLYFMAVADKFITSRRQFYFIALLPFVMITITLLTAAVMADPGMRGMWLTTAFVHASMCAGDFGLMSFFSENTDAEIITYDDVENGVSYFYSKEIVA